jgi:hypothetical protein
MSTIHGDRSHFLPDGPFWYDRAKQLRSDPRARLDLALTNLPLPAAYREAGIALRALIREHKKRTGTANCPELEQHYRLDAEAQLLLSEPYLEGIGPGHNVAELIPRDLLEALSYPYQELGYHLVTSSANAIRWYVEAWGEPRAHRRAKDLHPDFFPTAAAAYRVMRESMERARRAEWNQLLERAGSADTTTPGQDLQTEYSELLRRERSMFVDEFRRRQAARP